MEHWMHRIIRYLQRIVCMHSNGLRTLTATTKRLDLKREKILSPDGPANYIRPFVNQLSEESYELFVAYQLKVCERPDLIGAGAHTVDILRK